MAKIVTFGELMLRLTPPGREAILQSRCFVATFGGSEANVAVSLANYGEDVAFVSAFSEDEIGTAALAELRGFGVDTRFIRRTKNRMGVYYTQAGSNMRASTVIYDRCNSAISLCGPGDFDWDAILDDAEWFFISGITPAVSRSLFEATLEVVKKCREKEVIVACDLNYRSKLWNWGKKAVEVMPEIVSYVDVLIANEEDCQMCLGVEMDVDVHSSNIEADMYRTLSQRLFEEYPHLTHVSVSLRESISADYNRWFGILSDQQNFCISKKYEIRDIIDRFGGGDSYSAGLIYGIRHFDEARQAIEYAIAASALKHTIYGDYNRVKTTDVLALMKGDITGRVKR